MRDGISDEGDGDSTYSESTTKVCAAAVVRAGSGAWPIHGRRDTEIKTHACWHGRKTSARESGRLE